MRQIEPELERNPRVHEFCNALLTCCSDQDLLLRFLRDVLSYREISDISNRWAAAQALLDGKSQTGTAKELQISIATVNTIAQWVTGTLATGGAREVFVRLHKNDESSSSESNRSPSKS